MHYRWSFCAAAKNAAIIESISFLTRGDQAALGIPKQYTWPQKIAAGANQRDRGF